MKASMSKLTALVVVALLLPVMVYGAKIEGVVFNDSITVGGQKLPIRGAGLFRYLGIIKAYVGALYIPDNISPADVLADIPKRLEVEYFHAIEAKDFGAATNKILREQLDAETLERLRPRIDKHNALYRNVKPGDRYALTYLPGKGTELTLNGEPLGTIEGADFAQALYAMWLGDKPMNGSFKRHLLDMP